MFAAACPTGSVCELFAGFFARSIMLLAAVWTSARLALALLSCSSWALTLPSACVLLPCKAVRFDLTVFPLEASEGAYEVAVAVEAVDFFLGLLLVVVWRTLRRVWRFNSVDSFSTACLEQHSRSESEGEVSERVEVGGALGGHPDDLKILAQFPREDG
jgi:hypothetical protein